MFSSSSLTFSIIICCEKKNFLKPIVLFKKSFENVIYFKDNSGDF